MGKLDGKVAFVTGAGRGQGRSHAIALAREGADVIALDIAEDIPSIPYPLSTKDDLEETAQLVRDAGGRIQTSVTDVRDLAQLRQAVESGVAEFGELDIVVANAGVVAAGKSDPSDDALYRDIVDINMNGVWHTIVATVPSIIRKNRGGSIILTSSTQGLSGRGADGSAALFAYAASKHGVVGLMRSAANAYAAHNIRVNTVHPTGVATPMVLQNEVLGQFLAENPEAAEIAKNLLPVDFLQPEDVSEAVVWLASDSAKFITGVALPVDAGFTIR